MVLQRNKYDAAYFGDVIESGGTRHDAGYTNYLELHTNWKQKLQIQKFLTRHNIPKTSKILELGAGVGFMGKIATEEGYTDWTCVDWSNWAKRHEVYPVTEEDGLVFLQAQTDNAFDYIVSRAFLECIPSNQLQNYATEGKRVATNHIHTTFLSANTQYYEIKTIPDWATDFLNDPNIIIEDYRKDG